jgi:alkanesulfonate monooxygenase SsuD/methylene tetrahydromethanopterin reductase-like flavin-dependent oxidoreductase (luciferase family)
MFGHSMTRRGRRMEECLEVLREAFTGLPFEYDGRRIHVTPAPITPGGPALSMGGQSAVVARRAARFGMPMLCQSVDDGTLERVYLDACDEFGTTPRGFFAAIPEAPYSTFVAEDPDEAWATLGPYLLHDAQMYASWLGERDAATKSTATTVEELRAEHGNYQILTVDQAMEEVERHGLLMTQPLAGGIPPDLAWPSLDLIAEQVLPAVTAKSA